MAALCGGCPLFCAVRSFGCVGEGQSGIPSHFVFVDARVQENIERIGSFGLKHTIREECRDTTELG